jgi:2-succinyl-5-enolpyruvyl-6-hydroxy-3-cyclohexene-1-carboxylate synthase
MLPVSQELDRSRFERLFATPQGIDIERVATAFGARYVLAEPDEIAELLDDAPEGVAVIEVREDRGRETDKRRRMWQKVCRALRRVAW